MGLFIVAAIYLVKLFVKKSLNHDLDVALTPAWQYFIEQLIVILIFSLLFSGIVLIEALAYFEVDINKGNNDLETNNEEVGIVEAFFILYLIIGVFVSCLWFVSKFFSELLCNKKVFTTIIDGKEPWKIDQSLAKNILYLSKDNKKLKYVYNESIEIEVKYSQGEKVKKIYKSLGDIRIYQTIVSLLFIIGVCVNFYLYFNNIEKVLISLICTVFIITPLFIFVVGFNDYMLNEQEDTEERPQG